MQEVGWQVNVQLIFFSRESLCFNDGNVFSMKLVAESILEVVFLVDREWFLIVVGAAEDWAIVRCCWRLISGFFEGGDSGDAGAGAGLVMVGDAVMVAWSDDLLRCLLYSLCRWW